MRPAFRLQAENAKDVIFRWRFTLACDMEYVNLSIQKTGYRPDDFSADLELFRGLVHPDDLALLESALQTPDTLGEQLNVRWTHTDGSIHWTG